MKRVFALLFAMCLMTSALAESYVVYDSTSDSDIYGNIAYLLREDGTSVVEPGKYADIAEILPAWEPGGPLYCVTEAPEVPAGQPGEYVEGTSALMDGDGHLLTGFDYSYIYFDDNYGMIYFHKENGNSGFLDAKGNELVEGRYWSIAPADDGCFMALDDQNRVWAIGKDGAAVDTGLSASYVTGPERMGDPVELTKVPSYGDRSIYVDAQGKPAFDQSFASCDAFSDGYAAVQMEEDGPYGLIDTTGAFVLPAEYDSIVQIRRDGQAFVVAASSAKMTFTVFDGNTFEAINTVSYEQIPEARQLSLELDQCGFFITRVYTESYDRLLEKYYNPYGEPILTNLQPGASLNTYCERKDGTPERLSVRVGEREQLIDLNGQAYGQPWQMIELLLWQDGQGRFLVTDYDTYQDEQGEEQKIWSSRRQGVIDQNGLVLLEARYDSVQILGLDRYWVCEGTQSGMIDGAGNWYYTVNAYDYLMD